MLSSTLSNAVNIESISHLLVAAQPFFSSCYLIHRTKLKKTRTIAWFTRPEPCKYIWVNKEWAADGGYPQLLFYEIRLLRPHCKYKTFSPSYFLFLYFYDGPSPRKLCYFLKLVSYVVNIILELFVVQITPAIHFKTWLPSMELWYS